MANKKVAFCFLYFFSVMASYYVLKPVREALFLDSQGVGNFPRVHILLIFVTFFAAQAYDWLGQRIRGGRLAVGSVPLFCSLLLLDWAVMKSVAPTSPLFPPLVWLYYVGVSLYAVFSVALFWSLVHAAFSPEEGKRSYGFIAGGGILGGAAGGHITRTLVPGVCTSLDLLAVSALLLFPCLFLGRWLDAHAYGSPSARGTGPESGGSSLPLLWRDPYVGAMGLLIFFTLATEEFGDHQTQRVLHESGLNRDQLTAFFGDLYLLNNGLGFFLSMFVARFLQTRFGPGPGLIGLQAAALLKTVCLVVSPTPRTLLYTLGLDLAMHYSMFQSSKELLYTVTTPAVKFRAKAVIDTFLFRAGAGSAAVFVLLFLLQASLATISCFVVGMAVSAALLGAFLHRRYFQLLTGQGVVREMPSQEGVGYVGG